MIIELKTADVPKPKVKDIGTSLDVDFEWRNEEQAAHPGRRGRIQVPARRQST